VARRLEPRRDALNKDRQPQDAAKRKEPAEPELQGRENSPAGRTRNGHFHSKERNMSTELSTTANPARGLALQSFDDAYRFSKMVSASEFAPKDFKGKPESCLLAIQHGSEVGLSPMQSLQSIAVINGRPTIWGDAALALVQASPVCEFVREYVEGDGDAMTAVCEAKRRGYPAPSVSRFSVADAKKAGLWGKAGPWTQYPQRMLALRARGFALRNAFADALRGLITAEEAQDYPTHTEPGTVQQEPKNATVEAHIAKPAEPAKATQADMERSRGGVNKAKTTAELERMAGIVEQRLKSGFYTPAQADELLNLINGKLDFLTSEPEDNGTGFPHEAAQHEVRA
jgi:hypothetical protein